MDPILFTRRRPPAVAPDGQPDLFAVPRARRVPTAQISTGENSKSDRQEFVERTIERLMPVAVELAAKAGRAGITVADVRLAAVQRGILTGEERGRSLSFLAHVPARAGLVPKREGEQYRRSSIGRSHGNLHRVWVSPEHATP